MRIPPNRANQVGDFRKNEKRQRDCSKWLDVTEDRRMLRENTSEGAEIHERRIRVYLVILILSVRRCKPCCMSNRNVHHQKMDCSFCSRVIRCKSEQAWALLLCLSRSCMCKRLQPESLNRKGLYRLLMSHQLWSLHTGSLFYRLSMPKDQKDMRGFYLPALFGALSFRSAILKPAAFHQAPRQSKKSRPKLEAFFPYMR